VEIALDIDAAGQCSGAHIRGQAVLIFETRITL
jgi:hypothetical protein